MKTASVDTTHDQTHSVTWIELPCGAHNRAHAGKASLGSVEAQHITYVRLIGPTK